MVESVDKNEATPAKTLHNIVWNYLGHAFKLAVNFGLTFVMVRRLSVVEYGLFLFISSLSSTLYLLDLGLSSVLVQAYVTASLNRQKDSLRELLGTVVVSAGALGALGAIVLIGLSLILPGPFNIPPAFIHEASLVFIASAGTLLFGFLDLAIEPVYQASNRFDRVNQVQLTGSALMVIATVVALYLGYGIVALALIQFAVAAFQFLLSLGLLRSTLPNVVIDLAAFRWAVLKPLLRLSKWAFMNNISSYILEIFVWTILGSFSSMKEAALFGLASKIPRQLWNLVDRGAGVCLPLLSEHALDGKLDELRRIYLRSQRLVLGAVTPFVILGIVFARPLIQVWAGTTYTAATTTMQWLIFAFLGHAFLYSSDMLLYAAGHIRRAALIAAAGGALSIASALALVHRFGAAGMAFSMAWIQVVVVSTLFTREACRFARIPFRQFLSEIVSGLGLPIVVMLSGLCIVLTAWRHLSAAWMLVSGALLGAAYFLVWGFRTALPFSRGSMEASN